MHLYDQLSVLVSLVLFGMALPSIIELPINPLTLILLDRYSFPLSLSVAPIIALLLAAVVWTGIDSMVRSHPKVRSAGLGYVLTFCPLPTLFTSVAFSLVRPLSINRPFWLGGLALTGLILSMIILGEWRTIERNDGIARLCLNLIAYLVALVLYVGIFRGERSLLSAVAVLVASGLLALDLLRVDGRTWICALVAGLTMGEVAWALSYWPMGGLRAGMFLLLIFYVITGLAQQGLLGRLNRWILVEFAIVTIVGLVLLYNYTP